MLVVDCETDRSLAEAGYAHSAAFHRTAAERTFEYHTALRKLRATVVVCYDTETCKLYVSVPPLHDEGPASDWQFDSGKFAGVVVERDFESLRARLDEASLICGWNVAFDLHVLCGAVARSDRNCALAAWTAKAVDPMLALANHSGKYISLQNAVTMNELCDGADPDNPALKHTSALLKDQWLSGKNASGLKAIKMHRVGEWQELVAYCCVDVLLTVQLALRGAVNVPVPLRLHAQSSKSREVSCQTPPYWTRTTA